MYKYKDLLNYSDNFLLILNINNYLFYIFLNKTSDIEKLINNLLTKIEVNELYLSNPVYVNYFKKNKYVSFFKTFYNLNNLFYNILELKDINKFFIHTLSKSKKIIYPELSFFLFKPKDINLNDKYIPDELKKLFLDLNDEKKILNHVKLINKLNFNDLKDLENLKKNIEIENKIISILKNLSNKNHLNLTINYFKHFNYFNFIFERYEYILIDNCPVYYFEHKYKNKIYKDINIFYKLLKNVNCDYFFFIVLLHIQKNTKRLLV